MRIRWLATAWLAGTAGCGSGATPPRTYALTLDDGTGPAVVLAELVERSGGGDCPQYDPDRTVAADLTAGRGRLTIDKPPAEWGTVLLGLRFWNQTARWTIFRPGRVVTTVYPEWIDGSTRDRSPRDQRQASYGGRVPLADGVQPTGVPAGDRYPADADRVALAVVTRPLGDVTLADAADLTGQLSAVADALDRDPRRAADVAVVVACAEAQVAAMRRAGLGDDRCRTLTGLTARIQSTGRR